jgi:branched-chain amino acid transport system substrate-binding protein
MVRTAGWLAVLCGVGLLATPSARAADPITIGVLNDQSGIYADYQGIGSVIAAQMAVEDFGGKVGDRPVLVITADHQNKTDIGATIARQWFDQEHVAMIADVPNSAIALAVADLAREKNKVFIGSGAGSAVLTGEKCSPNTVHWTYDTWELGNVLGHAVVAQGHRKWFFLTADYAFGYDLETSTANAVKAAGGNVLGSVRHPLGTSDFSSFLLQAQGSGADVLALANAGGDTSTAIKQAAEFGLSKTMTIVGPIININVVQSVGLADAQGLLAVTPFYWDMNDGTRAFSARFMARHPHHIEPNDMQAGVYSSVLHYLKAIAAGASPDDGRAVVAEMKVLPTDDPLFGKGRIRADGRKIHPVYLMQTKPVSESKGEWDMFKLISTVPGDEAFRPLADGHCSLVN